jgi:hypothetical protein
MSELEKYDFEKLLDDIKLISKTIKIITDENNPENRKYACGLADDLVSRLYRDLKEMRDKAPRNGRGHGGYLKDGEVVED